MAEVGLLKNPRIRWQLLALARESRVGAPLVTSGGYLHEKPSRRHKMYRYRAYSTEAKPKKFKEEPRVNPVGIQYLSQSLQKQLFGNNRNSHKENLLSEEKRRKLINLSKQSLKNFDLLGKKTCIEEPISFELPKLQGRSLDEHFQKLGQFAAEPYKTMCANKFDTIVSRPAIWLREAGWMRYEPGQPPTKVKSPLEDTLVFDVETLYEISNFPTLAVALSSKAWYLWCSPFICGDGSFEHLIPMESTSRSKLIIGHNVAYDRARVLEEYNFQSSKTFFLDTQSLHIASSGLCSRQRPRFMKTKKSLGYDSEHDTKDTAGSNSNENIINSEALMNDLEEDPWLGVSAMNSLRDVAFLHCGINMNKEPRDLFKSKDKSIVIEKFDELVNYCATDVETTSKVFDKVFPLFLQKCPHPISFGALRFLSSCILPIRYNEWNDYINRSENIYQESKQKVEDEIIGIIEKIVEIARDDSALSKVQQDPWLSQLDWTIPPVKLTKKGVPAKNQKLPGLPEWYRSMFPNKEATKPVITIRSRNIPIFFRLSWEGYPCVWTDSDGWCFPVPCDQVEKFKHKNYFLAGKESIRAHIQKVKASDSEADAKIALFKIPHPNGPQFNCTTLLSKPYIHFFEKGILSSESNVAKEALYMNSSGSYWMSSRERIVSQFVVPENSFPQEFQALNPSKSKPEMSEARLGIILPNIVPMGTVTRRAVEKTWLTASNAKKNRIGSELKAQVRAPPGYCFVGADVDSEELWIASLVGDSVFNLHGGTPIGWMCLEGTKNEGTDLHTKTAEILGCTRSEAKIFNYGRIYGAGVKFAAQLLKQFNHSLTDEGAKKIAKKLYESTKGKTRRSKIFKKFWYGGSESILFNKLENIAEQEEPKTPVLGCGITASLLKKNLVANSFLPSRINWAIQSSGVDYLHLLTCSMHYLISKYHINARLCLSIHDEIRYLVTEEDKYRASMALQISNIWTRAIFCEQMGIDDLPQNCAFFSAVDIDHVMRKEVDMDCITPSNPTPIPHGESLNIRQLLDIPQSFLKDEDESISVSKYSSNPREPVFSSYNKAYQEEFLDYFLEMQIQDSKWKVAALESAYIRQKTSTEFKRDGFTTSFGFLDYLNDVEIGKKKRPSIMDTIPFESFNTSTSTDVKQASDENKKNKDVVNSSANSYHIGADVTLPGRDLNRKDEGFISDHSVIEELHLANSQIVMSGMNTISGASKQQTSLARRGRKKLGPQKAYETFFNSLVEVNENISKKEKCQSRIAIEEVVDDVLSDSSNSSSLRISSVRSKVQKCAKRSGMDQKHYPSGRKRRAVPIIDQSIVKYEPRKTQ